MTKLSIVMPCWMRPQRTARAIKSVIAQTRGDWQLMCIGDKCPVLLEVTEQFVGDQRIGVWQMTEHEGRYGTQCLNAGIELARGEYLCFLGNDDYLLPDHVEQRLASIAGTDKDVVYHDAVIAWPDGMKPRSGALLACGHVGGSELVIRTAFLRKHNIRFTDTKYGHDWTFIEALAKAGAKFGYSPTATYVVTHLPGNLVEAGID